MELITVRIGRGKKLHAMTEDGCGCCPVVSRMIMFGAGPVRATKMADGVADVTCADCCAGLLSYNCSNRGGVDIAVSQVEAA